jgi:hypothetical protein
MNKNTMLLIVIGSFSSLCCAMQQQQNRLFPNLSQPQTPFQQNPMQKTNVNIANLHQMHGTPVPQNVLNGLSGVDAIIANRYNADLASKQKK